MCKALLEEFRVEGSMYQMGKTRLFFRAGVLGHLEDTWARIQRSNSLYSHLTCLCAMDSASGVQHFSAAGSKGSLRTGNTILTHQDVTQLCSIVDNDCTRRACEQAWQLPASSHTVCSKQMIQRTSVETWQQQHDWPCNTAGLCWSYKAPGACSSTAESS